MGVMSVENISLNCPTLKHMRELTQELNHISVTNVERLLVNWLIYIVTSWCTPDLNHILAVNVERVLLSQALYEVMSAHMCKEML